jgi:hypothetical protein
VAISLAISLAILPPSLLSASLPGTGQSLAVFGLLEELPVRSRVVVAIGLQFEELENDRVNRLALFLREGTANSI